MPSSLSSKPEIRFNLNHLEPLVEKKHWRKWGLFGGLILGLMLIGGVGWLYRNRVGEREIFENSNLKIEPLVPKVSNESEVPVTESAKGFVFRADDVVRGEVIEINRVADWARVPGSREILYNRLDEKVMFLNGKLVRLEERSLVVDWEGYELLLGLGSNVKVVDSVNGKSSDLAKIKIGSVIQVVLSVDDQYELEISSIMIL